MDTRNISHRFAEKAGIQPKEAMKMIEAIGATIAEACGNLDIVAIPGFGNFSAQKRMSISGRIRKQKNAPSFRPS